MVAINFSVLVDRVEDGRKTQTIRLAKCYSRNCSRYAKGGTIVCDGCENPKLRYREGMKVQLYTGLRTKYALKLGEGTITQVTVVRYDDLTEELAAGDGFVHGYTTDCSAFCIYSVVLNRRICLNCTPLDKLRRFLQKKYKNPEKLKFVVVRWTR